MGINLVTFAASTVTPQDDALIYETALVSSGLIYGGNVTIKSANVLHVAAGHGALCGRKFTIEATDIPVALTPSGTLRGRVYIHMDLSDVDEPISFMTETAASLTPCIQDSDININNGVYEINLATFDVDTSTISNLEDVAPVIESVNSALTNIQGDLTSISETGTTASQAISEGTYFYLNGTLVYAKVDIANGATFTENTNYVVVTAGSLNRINEILEISKGFSVSIIDTSITFRFHNSNGNALQLSFFYDISTATRVTMTKDGVRQWQIVS